MPEMMQTTMLLRWELSLPSSAIHVWDIRVRGPALWVWMAILLQYWQDHISEALYGGWVRPVSELVRVLLRDINPWLPHKLRFGWNYITDHATLWLNVCEQFVEKHFQEWEAQKHHPYELGDLEHEMEFPYRRRLARRKAEAEATDSREEEAKRLPPEQQAAREEHRLRATPTRMDVIPSGMEGSLYPNDDA